MFKIITKIKEGCCSFPSAAPDHMEADMVEHTSTSWKMFSSPMIEIEAQTASPRRLVASPNDQ